MNNYSQSLKLITILITITILGIIYSLKLSAEPVIPNSTSIKFIPPPPPPDRSAAGDRGGEAAGRGCGNREQSLMALVPSYQGTISLNKEETITFTKIWGLTTSEYPTFWFYIPYKPSEIASIEFVLQDESQQFSKTIYRNFLANPETPGLISVSTKSQIPPLEISQINRPRMYHWFLKARVQCNPQQPANLHFVEGWIERTNLNSEFGDRFEQLTTLEKVAFFAEKGIWHDAVTNLAELSIANSNDNNINFQAEWKSLLQSVDLENLANYPLIDCCKKGSSSNHSNPFTVETPN